MFIWAARGNATLLKKWHFIFELLRNSAWTINDKAVCAQEGIWLGELFFGMPWVHFQGEFGPKLQGQVSSFRLGPRQEQPRFLLFQVTEFMYPSSKSAQVDLKCCQSGLRFASLSLTRKSPLDESLGRGRKQHLCVIWASTILSAVSFAFKRHT